MKSSKFSKLYIKAATQAKFTEMLPLMRQEVRCSKCGEITANARDAQNKMTGDFNCPKCNTPWVVIPR